jgi:hypothetical protein
LRGVEYRHLGPSVLAVVHPKRPVYRLVGEAATRLAQQASDETRPEAFDAHQRRWVGGRRAASNSLLVAPTAQETVEGRSFGTTDAIDAAQRQQILIVLCSRNLQQLRSIRAGRASHVAFDDLSTE